MTDILKDSLHTVSQGLMIPTMLILMILVAVTVASVGSIIVEAAAERRKVKSDTAKLILELDGKSISGMRSLIAESEIYVRHREALFTIIDNEDKSEETLVAAAKRMIADEEYRLDKKAGWSEMVSRIAPMFGLMGTLIPLGPGLLALGQGDTMTLADSLLVAFDTTVAGLVASAVCYVISKIRRRWYDDYMVSLETLMNAVLEEVSKERGADGGDGSKVQEILVEQSEEAAEDEA